MKKILLSFFTLVMCSGVAAQENKESKFTKFRIGGYGEVLFQSMDYGTYRYGADYQGSPKLDRNRNTIDLPRFVVASEYRFNKSWGVYSEIEFEHGGTGSGIEVEYTENLEYEYEFEKAGEVVLEQFYLEKIFGNALKVRVGHQILPVGLTNYQHEPLLYMGTTRPRGESTIIPCTWHETGLAVLGSYKWLDYQLMVVNGLDPLGFGETNWIQGGHQTHYEIIKFQNPAFAARLNFHVMDGLRIGVSGYYASSCGGNSVEAGKFRDVDIPVAIGSADMTYRGYGALVRANVLYGYVGDTYTVNKVTRNKYSGYSKTSMTPNALTYFVEAGYNVGELIKENLNVMPYVRYEYLNPGENEMINVAQPSDPRLCENIFAVGLSYVPTPGVILKADYSHCAVGDHRDSFNSENTFSIGVGFMGWFFQK